ncbi:MAG: HAMP domain-containing histidine kinase [Coriobacteriales bacterium]|jgi:signal transduction histidine kinase|nr:HAMP domain-containing histidine kinase [Coriobacteriales bacterium]
MRLFAKFFLCATFVVSIALLLSGYLLITSSHASEIRRETERALNQYQYDKFTVQADLLDYAMDTLKALDEPALLDEPDASATAEETATSEKTEGASSALLEDRAQTAAAAAQAQAAGIPPTLLDDMVAELSDLAAFYAADKTLLHSTLPEQIDLSLLDAVSDSSLVSKIQTMGEKDYLLVCGKVTQSGVSLYLVIATDISTVIAQKQQMEQSFLRVYLITLGVSMLVVLALSLLLTRPLNRMNRTAAAIARGRYSRRLPVRGKDEIGELSSSFNLMADAVEDRIYELSEAAQQKEDFVAGFAHELKTPLTSVIGYADMLYQKPLSPEQVKDAAWYILSEGLRLEALSQKLMDLIVLNRQDFVLEEIPADELLQSCVDGLMPLFAERKVVPHLTADPALIPMEYDLFKTLLLNLIDNAIKAGSSEVWVTGKRTGDRYVVAVSDNGRGIPAYELSRITEAFYMVDKSRSRKQHGAGLGLALAARIAELHGTTLRFHSAENKGTRAEIELSCMAWEAWEESEESEGGGSHE